jgi:photosystem II stability/assembly factor-like uncharacterized protein
MADKKISELPQLTNPTLDDLLAIVNNDITQKIKVGDLLSLVLGEGLPGNISFFIVPAETLAPDGEYYYGIKTDAGVPIYEGEISSGTPLTYSQDTKSKSRIDHSLELPKLGWLKRNVESVQINDIMFLDQLNGLAVTENGRIYKTMDGGRSWNLKYDNGNTNPISALDQSARGARVTQVATKEAATLAAKEYYTMAAMTKLVTTENQIIVQPAEPAEKETAETAERVASDYSIYATGGHIFYSSKDYGETWAAVDVSVTELQQDEKYVSVTGASTPFYLIGNKGTVVNVDVAEVTDPVTGIITLTVTPTFLFTLPTGTYTGITSFSVTGQMRDPITTIYVIGYDNTQQTPLGVVFKSIDNGVTWTQVYSVADNRFYGLFFSDVNTGWLAGGKIAGSATNGVVYKTTDGGTTWAMSDLAGIGAGELKDIHFGSSGWAVGDNSTVVKTTDGGTTWTKDTLFISTMGGTHNLLAVSAISNDVAYVAGDAGGQGKFFYFISDTVEGIKYTYTPVNTVWMKVKQVTGNFLSGFVCALNAQL